MPKVQNFHGDVIILTEIIIEESPQKFEQIEFLIIAINFQKV